MLCVSLSPGAGFLGSTRSSGVLSRCIGASNCAPESSRATVVRPAPETLLCTFPDSANYGGPTTVSDLSDGVSSDGRGPYVMGTDGVRASVVANEAVLAFGERRDSTKKPRRFAVNRNNPVPGGGGVPRGTITDSSGSWLVTQWHTVGTAVQNLHNIPVGQSVTSAMMNVSFHINGRFYLLQMGPLANGHCWVRANTVNGTGTSSGTIYRASKTKWVMDLPAGSVGRLFDLYNEDWEHAVDKGLYYVHLHYEIGN